MNISVPVFITILFSVCGLMGGLIVYIWRLKTEEEPRNQKKACEAWMATHETEHKAINNTISENKSYINKLKVDVQKIETRCIERSNVMERIVEKLDTIDSKFDKVNDQLSKTHSDIEVLKSEMRQITRINNHWDGSERRMDG
jgi:chromosome segregation ATPase